MTDIIEEIASLIADHEGKTGQEVSVLWLPKARFDRLKEAKDVWQQPYVYSTTPAERRRKIVGHIWGSAIKITKGKERTE